MNDEKLNPQEAIRERVANPHKYHRHMPIPIRRAEDLAFFANEVDTRLDWHEPDEQHLTAHVFGRSFDNTRFWWNTNLVYSLTEKQHVVLYVKEYPVIAVNLAALFAWATEDKRKTW